MGPDHVTVSPKGNYFRLKVNGLVRPIVGRPAQIIFNNSSLFTFT